VNFADVTVANIKRFGGLEYGMNTGFIAFGIFDKSKNQTDFQLVAIFPQAGV
jgi:hypothetical protein